MGALGIAAGCGGDTGDGRARSAPSSSSAGSSTPSSSSAGSSAPSSSSAGSSAPSSPAARVGAAVVRAELAGPAHLVVFAGMAAPPAASLAVGPLAPVTIDPALPAGLTLDPATGAIGGAAREPSSGRVHILRDARGATSTAWVEILPPPSSRDLFVAPGGDDADPGTLERPFRTVGRAARDLAPGATLYLRGGVYRESVELRRLQGTQAEPITIRSYPGERAVIDASEAIFAESPRKAWRKATGPGAHPDELESVQTFSTAGKDSSSRGAFLDRPSYTRLLTYSRLEDLRARNQIWRTMPVAGSGAAAGAGRATVGPGRDSRPGPTTLAGKRRRTPPVHMPWTYFGPGVHFDRTTGRVHIRLSPTANRVAGLEDYGGPRDPRDLPLAISSRTDRALGVLGCQHVRVADLGLFHGGDETVRIEGSADVVLDHVEVRAATYGLVVSRAARVRILHSVLDGGIPPWSFRSDFKGSYKFVGPDGERVNNNLVRKTQRVLLFMAHGNTDVEIAHSELTRGHDVYLAGTRTDFHHNRVHDIQDESLYLRADAGESGMRIHENVIERTLSAVSFWGRGTGERHVYRNLFDLRLPTAGHRPTGAPGEDAWRYGHPFKNTGNLGALYFYQNTVLVSRPTKPPFRQFSAFARDPSQIQPRWFLNNVFAVVAVDESGGRAAAFIPPPAYQALRGPRNTRLLRSDGNLWVRVGGHDRPLFRCTENNRNPSCGPLKKVWKLADARGAAGFEAHSREATDPGFRRAARIDRPGPGDDLRPGPSSPALGQGIHLPPDLPDPQRRRDARSSRPDAGAFAAGQPLLRVGVDGRLAY